MGWYQRRVHGDSKSGRVKMKFRHLLLCGALVACVSAIPQQLAGQYDQQAYAQQDAYESYAGLEGQAAPVETDSPITNLFNSVSGTFKNIQESAFGMLDSGMASVRELISGGSSALSRVSKQSIFDKLPGLPSIPFISSRSIDERPIAYFDIRRGWIRLQELPVPPNHSWVHAAGRRLREGRRNWWILNLRKDIP